MLVKADARENVVKSMAKEIARHCTHAGVNVSEDVAAYLVNLKFLVPSYGFREEKIYDKNFARKIIDDCLQDFLRDETWISTIRLQTYSENNFVDRENAKNRHGENILKKSRHIMKELVEMEASDRDSKEKLYKKIVIFTIVSSGMGNPALHSVLREAQAALYSIFRPSELDNFLMQPSAVKEEQLIEFARITNGIRLFNKDCQKGGDGIDDLPSILMKASRIIKDRINKALEFLMKRIVKLTEIFDQAYLLPLRTSQTNHDDFDVELPAHITSENLENMKRLSFLTREQECYMRKLLFVVEETMSSSANLIERFRETLLQLHDVVRYRSAVRTVQVYPLFIILSHIWEDMQKEVAVLSDINSYFNYIQSFTKREEITEFGGILNEQNATAQEVIRSAGHVRDVNPDDLHTGVTIVTSTDENLLNEAEFGGFCAWTLAVTEGLLVPGNSQVGFLKYKDRIYSFSSYSVALTWGKDPDSFIMDVYKVARARLELVKILKLYEDLFEVKNDSLLVSESAGITRRHVQVQTELHPIESYIDNNYTSSQWEFKRRALQMSRIINYRTKGQQTAESDSHFRASIGLQAGPSKAESTQNKRNGIPDHKSDLVPEKLKDQ